MKFLKVRMVFVFCVVGVLAPAFAAGGSQRQSSAQAAKPVLTGNLKPGSTYAFSPGGAPVYGNGSGAQPDYSGPNQYPIVEKPLSIRIATPSQSQIISYENNDQTYFAEERTNIHVEWLMLPESEYMEQLNLMFSSGSTLPDMIMNGNLTPDQQITLGSQGLVIPLNDLITKHTVNFKELLAHNPSILSQITSYDGNIYAMPRYIEHEANQASQRMWINRDFMDALGIKKLPETTEEFYNYLVAVRDGDPNGNGRKDEIPLIGAAKEWRWQMNIDGFLMNPFIVSESTAEDSPSNNRKIYLSENGTVEFAPVKAEWREGLRYLNRLCSEGLLARESFTIDRNGVIALADQDTMLAGAIPGGGTFMFCDAAGERLKSYEILPPLKGPSGKASAYFDAYYSVLPGSGLITKDCKYPDILMKWMDMGYELDYWLRSRYGVVDRDWLIPPAGTIAVDGGPAPVQEKLIWGTQTNAYWGGTMPTWVRYASYKTVLSDNPYELEHVLWEATLKYRPYYSKNAVPPISFSYEEAIEYSELNTLIIDYVQSSTAQFVTGGMNIDRDWDNYVRTLNNMGLPRLLKLYQTGFDRQWAKSLGFK
jgi:putative aldouronate transport system substrate-binding protein